MKTQQELMQELMQAYWGPGGTVDMVKEYNAKHGCDVKPWECVKLEGVTLDVHPNFDGRIVDYDFALTILYDDKRKKHRPVFVGDKIYCVTGNGEPWTISYPVSANFEAWNNWSWNPPTPKRTFKLNDVELPCPVYTPHNDNVVKVVIDTEETGGTAYFRFETPDQAIKVKDAICEILSAARDKEIL